MAEDGRNKKADPGWNDPPTLSYSPSNPPPKSRIGNKRIAFPLSSKTSANSSSSTNLVKPFSAKTAECSCADDVAKWDSTSALREVMKNVDSLLTNKYERNNDVRKKVENMKVMWENEEFSEKVQNVVLDMTRHLLDKNVIKANECHLQLVMENSVLCDTWIVAFKQLIQDISR